MPTITLFEHQRVSYNQLGWSHDDPSLSMLESLNEATSAEIISVGRHGLKATQYVGILRVQDSTFQILPKIDFQGDSDEGSGSAARALAEQSAIANLLHLLSYTHNLPIREQELSDLRMQRIDWFELLTRLFSTELYRHIKRGPDRAYILHEDQLHVMKGKWQISRQLTTRPHVKHIFNVAFDEFSQNTVLNQIFRYVVENLMLLSSDSGNRRLLRSIYSWLIDVERVGIVTHPMIERVIFNRLNDRYKPAFNMARMYLENEAMQLSAGLHQTFAFVFDMNKLFERFVAAFLLRHKSKILPVKFEEISINVQAKGKAIYLAEKQPEKKGIFKLSPDILFKRLLGKNALILDTKYKMLEGAERAMGVSESDMYQMVAYMLRFDCQRALLLYPGTSLSPQAHTVFDIPGRDQQVIIATLNLQQPLNKPDPMITEIRELLTSVLLPMPMEV